jgi:hypothetical protein
MLSSGTTARAILVRKLRRTGLPALLGAALGLTACGLPTATSITHRGGPSSTTVAPTSTATTSSPITSTSTTLGGVPAYEAAKAYAQSLALRLDQMPSGWSVNNSVLNDVNQERSAGCESDSMNEVPATIYAVGVVYDDGSGEFYRVSDGHAPELTEVIAAYDNPALTFGTFKGNLDGCTSFTKLTNPIASGIVTAVHGTMKRISAPKFGAESAAYMASVGEDGTPAPQGIIMARKGNFIVQLGLSGIQSVDKALLEHLMTLAMSNLP